MKRLASFLIAVLASLIAAIIYATGPSFMEWSEANMAAVVQEVHVAFLAINLTLNLYHLLLSLALVLLIWLSWMAYRRKHGYVTFSFGYDTGTVDRLIKHSKRSIVLLGTSNIRTLLQDTSRIEKWLNANRNRHFYALFLNPTSPHASDRGRDLIIRSTNENIAKGYSHAKLLRNRNSRFVPILYEGPYRYTAQCGDLFARDKERIFYASTSHFGGIEHGFYGKLPRNAISAVYADEVTKLLLQSTAHPPGYGMSIVAFVSDPAGIRSLITESTKAALVNHCFAAYGDSYDFFHFEQFETNLHMTLSPIIRTTTEFADRYRELEASDFSAPVPSRFYDFLSTVIGLFLQKLTHLQAEFDRLQIDEGGYVSLVGDDRHNESYQDILQIREVISEMVLKHTETTGDNLWRATIPGTNENYYLPKRDTPLHITVGRILAVTGSRVKPVDKLEKPLPIVATTSMTFREISLVNYAYKSFKRLCWREDFELGTRCSKEEIEAKIPSFSVR